MFKTITISRGVTVNVGDFQNKKLEVSVSYEVEPGETVEEAARKTADQCHALLAGELEPVLNELPHWRARQWRDLLQVPAPELRRVDPEDDEPDLYEPTDDELDEDDSDEDDDAFEDDEDDGDEGDPYAETAPEPGESAPSPDAGETF